MGTGWRGKRFSSTLDSLADAVDIAGAVPGLWLAPFLVAPSSRTATEHPEWIVTRPSGRPAVGMINPAWGGEVHVLDTTRPDVLEHLETLARALADMGWRYLKLDFTYAPSFSAQWADATLTPAQRVRSAYDAIRRGAGDSVFILGCGAPLGPCIGVVDGMRVGPDVAPTWGPGEAVPGYEDAAPATKNAWRNTLARSFMHRRLWLNDPDCLGHGSGGVGRNGDGVGRPRPPRPFPSPTPRRCPRPRPRHRRRRTDGSSPRVLTFSARGHLRRSRPAW